MTFKKVIITVFLAFILFSGCAAQYADEPPLSGEPVPTMEPAPSSAPDATGGGTVLNESEF